jgi:hypothetical protein
MTSLASHTIVPTATELGRFTTDCGLIVEALVTTSIMPNLGVALDHLRAFSRGF